jgi:flagellin
VSMSVSTNTSALRAGAYLVSNSHAAQLSMNRLSSGRKLSTPMDDPGELAVSMKLNSSIIRLRGALNNVQNAISFLEVQDGTLETAGKIIDRMTELKGLSSQDPMKSDLDKASYNNEFHDLQGQLYAISQMEFNGVSLFARYTNNNVGVKGNNETWFMAGADSISQWGGTYEQKFFDNTITINVSEAGLSGAKVSINRLPFLSALTYDNYRYFSDNRSLIYANALSSSGNELADGNETTNFVATLAHNDPSHFLNLNDISVEIFTKAEENISFLRAQNGGQQSRLAFNLLESLGSQMMNMRSAHGRMVDADLGEESTNLAKQLMLSQISASVLAQANASTNSTLMLLN